MLAMNSREHVDCVSRVVRNAERLPQAPVPSLIFDSWRRSMEQGRPLPGHLLVGSRGRHLRRGHGADQ